MKITGYREVWFRYSRGRCLGDANGVFKTELQAGNLLFIDTDEGISGVCHAIGATIAPIFHLIEGEDPRCVTGIHEKLNRSLFKLGNQGADYMATMAVDAALWDLKAKIAGEPLWRLLGARDRRVKAYASGIDLGLDDDAMAAFYEPFVALGFDAAKLKVGIDMDADLRRLGILRDLLSHNNPRPHLMIDVNEIWGVKQAIQCISRFEEQCDLAWVEEPTRRWDYNGFRKISDAVRAPLATGENLGGVEEYFPLVDHGGVDVLQFGKNRGVTVPLKLAHLAAAHELSVSYNHSWGNHLAHAAAAMANTIMVEVQDLNPPPCIRVDSTLEDGHIILGDSPGWGMSVDEALLAELSFTPPSPAPRGGTGPHLRRDGAGRYIVPARSGEGYYGRT